MVRLASNCLNGTFTVSTLRKWNESFGEMQIEYYDACKFVQPIEFVKKAGMQYENLKGDFIVRDGIPLRENMNRK